MARKVWRTFVVLFLVVMMVRVAVQNRDGANGEDTAPPVPDQSQQIVLHVEGAEDNAIPFNIERLNVYLVEDDSYPESFVFAGDAIQLTGKFPLALHVGYDENWSVLVGKPIPFSRSADALESSSRVHLPGEAPCPVTAGAFTIREVGEMINAETPLSGELWLRCSTPSGERTLRGTFNVKGTTWG